MRIPILKAVLEKAEKSRDYRKEYDQYHGTPEQIKRRAQRNAARRKLGLKHGDGKEADHKNPLSNGGSNSKRNLRAVSREINRKKGAKKD
ncbi:MAG: HNH endonuclease signature motif containing protein [Bacilli bacterium]|jgi:5-methylcytosine-specific restriction endonuclease McrA